MFRLHLTLLLLLHLAPAAAQNYTFPEPRTRLHRTTADAKFNREQVPQLSAPYPAGTLADTLPNGHYARVTMDGERVNYEFFQQHDYEVQVGAERGKLAVRVYDAKGVFCDGAQVQSDGKELRLDRTRQAFVRRDWRVDHLRIIAENDTLDYSIDESIRGSRTGYFLRKSKHSAPVYVVLTPYRLVRNTYRYFKRGIRWGEWNIYNYPGKRWLKPLFHPPAAVGYVSTNQPKYQPGDTLKVSTYLSTPKGRPLRRDSLEMTIYTRARNYSRETVLKQAIPRGEPGSYATEIVLPEGWPLDKTYTIDFTTPGSRDVTPNLNFKLADYELDEYQLSIEGSEKATLPGSAWVDVKATDINNLPLPNAQLELILLTESVQNYVNKEGSLVLPDTLWSHTEGTDGRTDRRIFLPDSLFPQGYALNLTARVQLTGPSGEGQTEAVKMTVDRRYARRPELSVRGDSLLLRVVPTKDTLEQGLLYQITPDLDTTITPIDLPSSLPLNHQLASYQLSYADQLVVERLSNLSPVNGSPATWVRDTLNIVFPNPHQQPLQWQLLQNGEVIASGDANTNTFSRVGFQPETKLTLHYRHLAGGTWQYQTKELTTPDYEALTDHENLLELTLKQPEKVLPGQTVRVEIAATDQRGRPAAGVRLSAGSYNARFDKQPVTTPDYRIKRKRVRERQGYTKQAATAKWRATPPASLLWVLDLDTALAYRLRYPNPEYVHYRRIDSLLPEDSIAHIAPFIIKDHKPVTIRTVHISDRLSYLYHPNILTPYSIPSHAALRTVTLRTDEAVYSKRLRLIGGTQLVISFDADRYAAAGWTREERKQWSEAELGELEQHLFTVRQVPGGTVYHYKTSSGSMLQSARTVRYSDQPTPLGVANTLDQLRVWLPDGDSVRVSFEPGASYRISKERDRLYPYPDGWLKRMMSRPADEWQSLPGLPSYQSPKFVVPSRLPKLAGLARSLKSPPNEAPRARLQFAELPAELLSIYVRQVDSLYLQRVDKQAVSVVSPGNWHIVYHLRDSVLLHQRQTLPENKLTLVRFDTSRLRRLNYFEALGNLHERKMLDTLPGLPETRLRLDQRYFYNGQRISGQVIDGVGEALIGVTIYVEGTNIGTITDLDGRFQLDLPIEANRIKFSYLGYTPLSFDLTSAQGVPETIVLEAMAEHLDEVVVIGYGTTRSRDLTGGITRISSDDMRGYGNGYLNSVDAYVDASQIAAGAAPNIMIRGSSTPSIALKYFINGVEQDPFNFPQIDENRILSIKVIEGIVYITTTDVSLADTQLPASQQQIRQTFADYAAYQPYLKTDANGQASFNITFPDDITAWNTFAVGQDRKRRVGFKVEQTRAFLPVQAQLYLPRFLVEGDRSEARTLAVNREQEPQQVRLAFNKEGEAAGARDTMLEQSVERSYPISAGELSNQVVTGRPVAGQPLRDTQTYTFTLQSLSNPDISDGERRDIPIYPRGTEMVAGELLMLQPGEQSLPAEFVRPERGPVTLRLLGNRVEQLLGDLDYVIDYPYACGEQTASRLIGLLARRSIRRAEGKDFKDEDRHIRKMVKQLQQLQQPDGGFGWWASSTFSTPWISLHAYKALAQAGKEGFTVDDLTPVTRYLLTAAPTLPHYDQLALQLTLAEQGNPPTPEELYRLDTVTTTTGPYQLLARMRLHQLAGDSIEHDTLLKAATRHLAGGIYWGQRGRYFYRRPLDNRLACSLLGHRILRSVANTQAEADSVVNYLLGNATNGSRAGTVPLLGTNTLESAQLLAELLPDLLEGGELLRAPEVALATGGSSEVIKKFPHETTLPAATLSQVSLTKTGAGPLPASVYQRYFERAPEPKDAGYAVSTRLLDARDRPLETLTKGETAYLEVTVEAAADGEYVLVELPIPAGCSYADRSEAKGPYAVHRAYERDRVAIFCDRLPAGRHTYRVWLEPRFSGRYTLNPARVELQYLPVVNGLGEIKTVEVR